MPDILYFEDFAAGQSYDLGMIPVTRDAIIEFASEFDPQPFHLDDAAGKASLLGGLSASGWHTCAMVMRLLADNLLNRSSSKGAPGVDKVVWKHPVYPGDTLAAEAHIVKARPLATRPDLGLVFFRITVRNQDARTVLLWENPILFAKRTSAQ